MQKIVLILLPIILILMPILITNYNREKNNVQNIIVNKSTINAVKTLLDNVDSKEFNNIEKNNILPSEYVKYYKKSEVLDIFKKKINKNSNFKTELKILLEQANIIFNADDENGILKFTITIAKIKKTFTINDFDKINIFYRINQKIYDEYLKKTMPKIKPGSKWKTASQVKNEDIIITPSDKNLQAKIVSVKEKEYSRSVRWLNIVGSNVEVEVKIFSSVPNTIEEWYKVDLSGFVNSWVESYFYILINKENQIKGEDFVISNKSNILPSDFQDTNLIKNVLKNLQKHKIPSNIKKSIKLENSHIRTLKKVIDNNLKITFNPNDKEGILKFKIQLGHMHKTFVITGFKKSS